MKERGATISVWRELIAYQAEALYRTERELKNAGVIPLAAYDILIELENATNQRMRMYDLSQACVLTKSGVTKIVDRLEKQGYLMREKCPSDRRGLFAVISPKGRAAVRAAWPVYRKCIEKFFASALSETEMASLRKLLRKLRDHMPGFMEIACNH